MYILCMTCGKRSHISEWKRVGVYIFACPHCGQTKIID